MILTKDKKIMIVGLGLIGGTYAKILSDKGFHVNAIDIDSDAIKFAKEKKYIVDGFSSATKENLKNIDLIIVCLYPEYFINFVKENIDNFDTSSVMTDVTGIKSYTVSKIQNLLYGKMEFIAAHPMAGGERSKVYNVDEKVFENANYIVVPTELNTEENIVMCEELGRLLGFSKISRLSIEKHDEMIAFLSQLTHVIACTLMTAVVDDKLSYYTGDSFRDLTRIARMNEDMWSELFLKNRDALLREMDKFEIEFNKMKDYLIKNDAENIKEMMRLSTRRRDLFEKK